MQKAENSHLFLQERQDQILTMLNKEKKLLVTQLSEVFHVSPATIRNDLKEMEGRGLLVRTHGGAILNTKSGAEKNSVQKQSLYTGEKRNIALCASQMVEDGDTIAIDTGTTTMAFAEAIAEKKNLTVITNDLCIALYLEEHSSANIVIIGGIMRRGFHCSCGSMAVEGLKGFRIDKCFLATNGLTAEVGLSTPDMGHAEVKKQLIAIASQVIVLCDSSKIGTNSFCAVAPASVIHILITDSSIGRKLRESLEDMDIIVKICDEVSC